MNIAIYFHILHGRIVSFFDRLRNKHECNFTQQYVENMMYKYKCENKKCKKTSMIPGKL